MLNSKPQSLPRVLGVWGLCLSLLATAITALLWPAMAMASSPVPNGAIWIIDYDFTNQTVDAKLTVKVGIFQDGKMILETASRTLPLECTEVGALNPHSDGLEFDGSSYLECDFPDIAPIAYKLSKGQLSLAPTGLAINPYIEADFAIDPNAASPNELPPTLFHHPNITLRVSPDANNNNAALGMRVGGAHSWSDPYQLSGGIDVTLSSLKLQNSPFRYQPIFVANEEELVAYGNNLTTPHSISTGAATIYVGMNGFTGVISRMRIDPPCIGGGI